MISRGLRPDAVGSVPNPVQLVLGEYEGAVPIAMLGAPNVGWLAPLIASMRN